MVGGARRRKREKERRWKGQGKGGRRNKKEEGGKREGMVGGWVCGGERGIKEWRRWS